MDNNQCIFKDRGQLRLGVPLMVLILCGGILLTVRQGVLQMRRLPLALIFREPQHGTELFHAKHFLEHRKPPESLVYDSGEP